MMAVPQFSDIVKDPEFQGMNTEERQQVIERFYTNVVQKDPEFSQMSASERNGIHSRLYTTAGVSVLNEEFRNAGEPSLSPKKPEKEVGLMEGLGNVAEAIGGGMVDAGKALVNPETYNAIGQQIGGAFQTEAQTAMDDMKPQPMTERLKGIASPHMAAQGGAYNAVRDIVQLPLGIWADLDNAYHGEKRSAPAFQIPRIQELPIIGDAYKRALSEHPVYGFAGEQVPFLLPVTRATKASKLKDIMRAGGEGAVIGAATAPEGSGLQGRVTGAAAGAGLATGIGAGLGVAGRVMTKELPKPKLQGRVEIKAMPSSARDLKVQELDALHNLDTRLPNEVNPVTGKPYGREQDITSAASESASAIKSSLEDVKTAESIYKTALSDHKKAILQAVKESGIKSGDPVDAQRTLAARISELEDLGNTGTMSEAEGAELMAKRDAYDQLLQTGRDLTDAEQLRQEVQPEIRADMGEVQPIQAEQPTQPTAAPVDNIPANTRSKVKEINSAQAVQPQAAATNVVSMNQPANIREITAAPSAVTPPEPLRAAPTATKNAKELDILFGRDQGSLERNYQQALEDWGPNDPQTQMFKRAIDEKSAPAGVTVQPKQTGPRVAEIGEATAAPKVTPNTRELGFVTTLKDSPRTGPELKGQLSGTYDRVTNVETLEKAKQVVDTDRQAAQRSVLDEEQPTAETYATAQELMRRYQNEGNFEEAARIAQVIAERATKQGQAIQALSMWSRLSPEGALLTAERIAKQAGKGESKAAVSGLESALSKYRKSGSLRDAAKIKNWANKTTRSSFKKALAKLSQEELDDLGKVLGC